MKNLKKLLAVIIAVALMATMVVPAFAAESDLSDAEICEILGMLKGSGEGVTEEYLASATERNQAAIMFLRLLGLEEEALAFDGEDNFDDAEELGWAGGRAILAYLKANPELGWIGDGGNFKPRENIDAKSYYKVMLEALGYKQGVDFEWSEVLDFAAEKGLAAIADVDELTNADIATATVEALSATVKDEDITLIEKLIEDGIVSLDDAVEAGLVEIIEEPAAEAKAVGVKKFEVSFNQSVDTTKATFAIKKGNITINTSKVEWNEDNTVATITVLSNITKGDYTITIGGLDMAEGTNVLTVVAEDEKVAEIEITSDVAPLVQGTTDVTIYYNVKNQYGEDVTSRKGSEINWTTSQGTNITDVSNGIKRITGPFQLNNVFTVTALHPTTGTYATKIMKVGDYSRVAKIEAKSLYHKDDKTLFTNSTYTEFYVVVEAYDQYDNKVTNVNQLNNDPTNQVLINQTTVIITNPAVLGTGTFAAIPGTDLIGYQLAAPANPVAGSSSIYFYANITGHQSEFKVDVAKPAELDSLVLESPADIAVVGEKLKIPFTALDQNGAPLAEKTIGNLKVGDLTNAANDVNITSSGGGTASFSYNYETQKGELILDLTGATKGNTVVMAVTRTGKVSQITVDVKDVAKATAVVGTKDLTTLMSKDAVSTIKDDNILVVDQYGRTMTLDSTWFTKYKLVFKSSDEGKVKLPNTGQGAVNEITADGGSLNMTGVAAGTSTISVNIFDLSPSVNDVIPNSGYEFTAQTVAKSAITEYKVELPEVLYAATSHAKAVNVYGLTSGGSKVAINAADYVITANTAGVTYDDAVAGKLDASGVDLGGANKEKAVTVITVVSGDQGPVTLANVITVTNKDPVLTTLEAKTEGNVTVKGDVAYVELQHLSAAALKGAIKGKDQYGVAMTPVITNVLITNFPSSVTVTNNGQAAPTFTGEAAGDTFTATFITDNGLTIEVNVVVKANSSNS
jgi:hypothetical protein